MSAKDLVELSYGRSRFRCGNFSLHVLDRGVALAVVCSVLPLLRGRRWFVSNNREETSWFQVTRLSLPQLGLKL